MFRTSREMNRERRAETTRHGREAVNKQCEYALLLTLIALAASATIQTLGQSINNIFSNANAVLTGYST